LKDDLGARKIESAAAFQADLINVTQRSFHLSYSSGFATHLNLDVFIAFSATTAQIRKAGLRSGLAL
jgi:hypothetical protein